MTYTEKHIVETYSGLLEGSSSRSRTELIESLSKSLKPEKKIKKINFYKSFVAYASEKSAEEIITATSILWAEVLTMRAEVHYRQYIQQTNKFYFFYLHLCISLT